MTTNRNAMLLTFLLTLALNSFFAPLGMMDFNHEATHFKPAVDLVDGKMLFRDSYSQYGPVPIVLQALAISAFGKYVLVAKLEVALVYAIAGVALHASWRLIIGTPLAVLSIVIWNFLSYHFLHVFLAWASAYALMFQCIGLYLLMLFSTSQNRVLLIGVGACAILAILSKQNVGVYFLAAAFVCLAAVAIVRRRPLKTFSVDTIALFFGFGLVLIPYISWLASNGAVGAWWLDNFIYPRQWAARFGEQFGIGATLDRLTAFRLLGNGDPYNSPERRPDLVFALMPLVTLGTACYLALLVYRRSQRDFVLPTLVLCLVSLASWLQFFPIPGIGHVWWSCAPMIGLFVWVARKLISRFVDTEFQFRLTVILVVLIFSGAINHRIGYFFGHQVFGDEKLALVRGANPLRGMILPTDLAKFVGQVEAAIRENMGTNPTVLLDSANGIYLTFMDNPKFFHPIWGVPTPEIIPIVAPDYPALRERFISEKHPFVIADSWLVDAFLAAHPRYKIVAKIDGPPGPPPYIFVLLH